MDRGHVEDRSACSGVEISAEEAVKGMPESEMSLAALKASIAASKELSTARSNPSSRTTSPNSSVAASNTGTDSVKGAVGESHKSGASDTGTSEGPLPESDIDSSAPNSPGNGVR